MPELKQTLSNRRNKYGSYSEAAKSRAIIMNEILKLHMIHNKTSLPMDGLMGISDIINKVLRLAATPSHIDSWHDIAGYATINEKYYKEKEDANK